MRALAITSTLLAMLIVGAQAWWCTPHMVIAEIARQNLNDGVEDKVNTYFGFLHQFFSQSENMVSGACWADDLKSSKLETMASWHFINQPYDPTGFPISQWPIQEENVQTTINQFEETVKKADSNEWITAFAVANLVHFYGDIHQPLHATELFNEVYPKGDKGGNLIKVVVPWDSNPFALHFVWDSVAGQYLNSPNRPLNGEDFAYIKSLAAQYQANFSVPDSEKKVWNSTVMALESYEWAVQYAYANNTIQAGDVLTQEYLANVMTVSGFRITTAGYRLASELNYLFGKRATGQEMLARVASAKREYKDAIKGIRRPVNKN